MLPGEEVGEGKAEPVAVEVGGTVAAGAVPEVGVVVAVVLVVGAGGNTRFQVSEPTTPSARNPAAC